MRLSATRSTGKAPPADFVPHLLRTLLNIHRYNGEHPLRTLLVSLKTQYGTDVQAQIDVLLPSIDALPEASPCPTCRSRSSSATPVTMTSRSCAASTMT